jgi:hypothetical protein
MMNKINNWFKEYKKRYKIISIKISESEFLDENETRQEGIMIRIYSLVLEDLGIILRRFRYYPGLFMPHFEEYDFSGYDPGINPFDVSFENLEDVNFDSFSRNCNIALELKKDDFQEFYDEFKEFCLEWRFVYEEQV